jgi:hypothetical protein
MFYNSRGLTPRVWPGKGRDVRLNLAVLLQDAKTRELPVEAR